jgi:hypothetical protein
MTHFDDSLFALSGRVISSSALSLVTPEIAAVCSVP